MNKIVPVVTGYDGKEKDLGVIKTLLTSIVIAAILCGFATQGKASVQSVSVVKIPAGEGNCNYVGNRAPLKPAVFVKLPVGAVKPSGWLGEYLIRQKDGLTGHLGEISAWLQKEDNAWLSKDGKGKWGWEELPYWLKGYANIGYILDDEVIIKESRIWIEGALASQRADGDFGPDHRFGDGNRDYWANMIMMFCLQSYYEYTQDQRVLELMTRYFKYQLTVPDEKMLVGYWQRMRGGDNLYSIYWLYNRTGDEFLLDVAEKMHRNTANWRMKNDLPNWHNVNVAQAFGEPATYYQQSKNESALQAAYDNFHLIRERYGNVPGGMFGGDEYCRPGYDDPRQCIETCGVIEQMLSNELLLRITGDTFWADHCELLAFNAYPAAVMPDFRALRYLTGPNMTLSDKGNHKPGIDLSGPFFLMNPFSSRCCQHNHSHGWPYFTEHLWMATRDDGLCAAMFSACQVQAKVANGRGVTITETSNYPFEEVINFKVKVDQKVRFPLYLRIPGWCKKPAVKVNGKRLSINADDGKYIRIERTWKNGDTVEYELPMELNVQKWEKNHNSVSVNYGPLTFSLKIGENYVKQASDKTAFHDSRWQKNADMSKWPSYEIHASTPWNYGLVMPHEDIAKCFTVKKKAFPADNFPFTHEGTPIEIIAKGAKIPEWTMDVHNLCGILQDSPVATDEPAEDVTLIPMGAARLRISAFPVIGDGPEVKKWQKPKPPFTGKPSSSFHNAYDDINALCDQIEPDNSNDHSVARVTFWPHKDTTEWVQYDFKKPMEFSAAKVYFFDDRASNGGCRIPQSWCLNYLDSEGKWQTAKSAEFCPVKKDAFNEVTFSKIRTKTVRLEVKTQTNYSAGILEWKMLDQN